MLVSMYTGGAGKRPTRTQRKHARLCPHKAVHASQSDALHEADCIALFEWGMGRNKAIRAYQCQCCGKWHTGTLTASRDDTDPIHHYTVLSAPS